jgi:lambda family phage portal protein
MAKTKQKPKSAARRSGDQLPIEVKLREARARFELQALRGAAKAQKAMLAVYAAADRGRRNKDWRAPNVSADAAIIPDLPVLCARVRQMVRDNAHAKSTVRAFVRNVVGCGILPIPQARDSSGELLEDVNKALLFDFWDWAGDPKACDVEKRQTFWAKQALVESERVTVGTGLVAWSYTPNLDAYGRIDRTRPPGLRLQSFEVEQLDLTIQSATIELGDGSRIIRQVKGGVEVDENNAAVAYHVYTSNPGDSIYRMNLKSTRIPAERVFCVFRQERTGQTLGVTELSSILQDLRDAYRHKDAVLWRKLMEACIGLLIKQSQPGKDLPNTLIPRANGDVGTTPSGLETADFVPGMIGRLGPGEDVVPFVPSAQSDDFETFQRSCLRAVAAGAGISYGQISRDFTQGTYSGQRQEMLEDKKEFDPLTEMHAHGWVLPLFALWVTIYAMEGRLDSVAGGDGFSDAPRQYTQAEFVGPPPTWIDPEKEANGLARLLELKVITRDEIAHMRGNRLFDVLEKLAKERKVAAKYGIAFAEDANTQAESSSGGPAASPIDQTKGELDAAGVAVRAGILTPQTEDEDATRQKLGLPPMGEAARASWEKDGGVRRPITIATAPDATGGDPGKSAGLAALTEITIKGDKAPNYRFAVSPDGFEASPIRCGMCRFYVNGKCEAYDFTCAADHVCDAFEASPPMTKDDAGVGGGRRVVSGPGVQEGDRKMDDTRSSYLDRGQRGVT